jgi:FNIP Repeat
MKLQCQTRSVRRKLNPSVLDTLTPILSVLYSFLDDESAFRFFRVTKKAWDRKKSYHIKSTISLYYSEEENYFYITSSKCSHFCPFFPSYLLSRIEKLCIDYVTCCIFLTVLENEDPNYKDNVFLREVTFQFPPSVNDQVLINPEKFPHHLPSRLTSLRSYHPSSYFNGFKSYAYFSCLTSLYLMSNDILAPFLPGDLPESLTSLSLHHYYTQELLPNVLPLSLIELDLGWNYNKKINEGVLPNSLTRFICGCSFNQPLPTLPYCLVELILEEEFNLEIPSSILPLTLESLWLGSRYNQPLPCFPTSFRKLQFSQESNFDQPIIHPFPLSFRILIFGACFNQSLYEGILNIGIEKLVFGDLYNTKLSTKALPNTLQGVSFNRKFNQPIEPSTFPPSLQRLEFGQFFNQELNEANVPTFLKCLMFGSPSLFNQVLDTTYLQHLTCLILPLTYSTINLKGNDIFSLSFFKCLYIDEDGYYNYKAQFPGTKWRGRKARQSKTKLCQECQNYMLPAPSKHYYASLWWEVKM